MNKRIRGLLTSDPLFYSIGLATILLEAIPGRRFLHTKKQEERPLAFPPVHKRSGIDFFLEHTAFLGGIIVGVAGLFVFLLGPDFLGHRRPCGGVIVALGAQMIHAFGGLHVGEWAPLSSTILRSICGFSSMGQGRRWSRLKGCSR